MCERCVFSSVKDYKSALFFVKRYLMLRLRNLLFLAAHEGYEKFLETARIHGITYIEIFSKMSRVYNLTMELEGNLISEEKFLDEVKDTDLEIVFYNVNEYLPNTLKHPLQENRARLLQEPETMYEKICNHLYLVKCSWVNKK